MLENENDIIDYIYNKFEEEKKKNIISIGKCVVLDLFYQKNTKEKIYTILGLKMM